MLRILTPWDSQPQEPAQVNRESWQARGLSLWYPLNGNTLDPVKNNLGTLNSGARFAASSRGLAAFFDGSDDYISWPSTTLGTGNTFTASAWVYISGALTARQTVFGCENATTTFQMEVGGGTSGLTSGGVSVIYNGALVGNTANGVLTGNVWVHVAYIKRTSGVAGEFYVNGLRVADGNNFTTDFTETASVRTLGRRAAASQLFNGMIQDARINNFAMSAQEVLALYQDGLQLFAPRSIWVPVSVGGGSATNLTVQDATHAHTADSPTLTVTTSTSLTIAEALHAHTADNLTITVATTLAVQEALHAHTADNLTVSTTGAVSLTIQDAPHAHTADALALTLDTALAIADATHAHTADNLTISTSGAVNLTVDDATHAHTADSPTLTLGYVDLIVAEALHGHTADSPTLSVVEYTDLIIARAVHAHMVDNLTLTFPLGALSDAEFREMYEWVKELHRIHGLTPGVDLVVTPTSRTAGAISQTISTAGSTVTVTR